MFSRHVGDYISLRNWGLKFISQVFFFFFCKEVGQIMQITMFTFFYHVWFFRGLKWHTIKLLYSESSNLQLLKCFDYIIWFQLVFMVRLWCRHVSCCFHIFIFCIILMYSNLIWLRVTQRCLKIVLVGHYLIFCSYYYVVTTFLHKWLKFF